MKEKLKIIAENRILVWIIRVIAALAVVFVLNIRIEIIESIDEYNSIAGKLLMQFAHAFSSNGLGELIEFAAMLFIFDFCEKKQIKRSFVTLILAFVLSLTYIICLSFKFFNDITLLRGDRFQYIWTIYTLIGYTVLIDILIRILYFFVDLQTQAVRDDCVDSKTIWRNSAICIFICLFPWIIMNYPGSFSVDGIAQIKQVFGAEEWSALHPVLSTLVMGGFAWIGYIIGSINFGIFMYALIQLSVCTMVFSYGIKKSFEWGCNKNTCYVIASFFCFIPLWGTHMQWIEKSLLYAAVAVFLAIEMFDIAYTREVYGKRLIIISVLTVCACFLRNDGKYLVIPCLIIMAIFIKKEQKRSVVLAIVVTMFIVQLISNAVFPAVGINKGSVKEALSIPFMQTARYVVAYNDEVTPEEREAIDGVLDYSSLEFAYDPVLSDRVKGTYKEDSSKLPAYFKVWVSMFFKHPNVYFSALINKSYGYLAPVEATAETNFDYGQSGFMEELGVRHLTKEFPQKVFNMIHVGSEEWPVFKYTSMCGTYTWITLVCLMYIITKRRWKEILLFIPAFLNLAICIASPCHNSLRYYLSVIIMCPFFIAWMFRKRN